VATARRDDVPLASARSGQRERVFMITGIGVHDRTDRPFKITGMRNATTRCAAFLSWHIRLHAGEPARRSLSN
jgi:hypothetical protein